MIRAHHLQKSYGEHLAVDDISLVANPGEILGLLGPNGAGKSTTISMLVGLLTPDSGHVELEGESDPTRPHLRSRLGLSPQDLSLYESLDARENLDFFGRLHGLRGRALADRVAWCLEFADHRRLRGRHLARLLRRRDAAPLRGPARDRSRRLLVGDPHPHPAPRSQLRSQAKTKAEKMRAMIKRPPSTSPITKKSFAIEKGALPRTHFAS